MRETYGIVRRLQVLKTPFASAPDAAIAVLVAGEILESASTLLLFGSAGFPHGQRPANPKTFSTLMFRSNMNPSKLEWATLFLNSRTARRGQMLLRFPCSGTDRSGSGSESQKPFSSEPAATLPTKVLSGLVIQ